MDAEMFKIEKERPEDAVEIEILLDLVFGDARFSKPSYRLRQGRSPITNLSLVARNHERLIGTVRFWQVRIGDYDRALLLGPLAVHPTMRGLGAGISLIQAGLERAAAGAVILVGDEGYYRRTGFSSALAANLVLPGLDDYDRLLAFEIVTGDLDGVTGIITKDENPANADWRGAIEGLAD